MESRRNPTTLGDLAAEFVAAIPFAILGLMIYGWILG